MKDESSNQDGQSQRDLQPVDLLPADLLLIRGTRWLDFPVKLVTQSQYTHVAGFVGGDKLIEAQGLRKTGYADLAFYHGASDVYRCPGITLPQMRQILQFVHQEIGQEYDYILLGWEAIRLVFGVVLPYLKHRRRICSTLWADAYKAAGIELCPGISYPTPADLVRSRHMRKVGRF